MLQLFDSTDEVEFDVDVVPLVEGIELSVFGILTIGLSFE